MPETFEIHCLLGGPGAGAFVLGGATHIEIRTASAIPGNLVSLCGMPYLSARRDPSLYVLVWTPTDRFASYVRSYRHIHAADLPPGATVLSTNPMARAALVGNTYDTTQFQVADDTINAHPSITAHADALVFTITV